MCYVRVSPTAVFTGHPFMFGHQDVGSSINSSIYSENTTQIHIIFPPIPSKPPHQKASINHGRKKKKLQAEDEHEYVRHQRLSVPVYTSKKISKETSFVPRQKSCPEITYSHPLPFSNLALPSAKIPSLVLAIFANHLGIGTI